MLHKWTRCSLHPSSSEKFGFCDASPQEKSERKVLVCVYVCMRGGGGVIRRKIVDVCPRRLLHKVIPKLLIHLWEGLVEEKGELRQQCRVKIREPAVVLGNFEATSRDWHWSLRFLLNVSHHELSKDVQNVRQGHFLPWFPGTTSDSTFPDHFWSEKAAWRSP